MNAERIKLYKKLEQKIGNTPLKQYDLHVPNNNKIYVKYESMNPFGSHYDRVYLDLFRHFETHPNERFRIKPGDKVVETSSGSAGISFASIGNILGYHCVTVLPAGGEKARETAILKQLRHKEDLILTPKEDYVNGFESFLRNYLTENKDVIFLNHSMGPRNKETGKFTENKITTNSLQPIGIEILKDLAKIDKQPDYVFLAIGNGSNILGPARIFENEDIKIIGYETFQSGTGMELKYPGKYENLFGILPGTLSRHKIPGTSYPGIKFPHLKIAIEDYVKEIVLVTDKNMNEEYTNIIKNNKNHSSKQKTAYLENMQNLIHWNAYDYEDLGRSSQAGLSVALDYTKKIKEKNLVIVSYDSKKRYDEVRI